MIHSVLASQLEVWSHDVFLRGNSNNTFLIIISVLLVPASHLTTTIQSHGVNLARSVSNASECERQTTNSLAAPLPKRAETFSGFESRQKEKCEFVAERIKMYTVVCLCAKFMFTNCLLLWAFAHTWCVNRGCAIFELTNGVTSYMNQWCAIFEPIAFHLWNNQWCSICEITNCVPC